MGQTVPKTDGACEVWRMPRKPAPRAQRGSRVSVQQQNASAAIRRMRELADPDRAKGLQRFFKTAPGQYGAGDKFLGLYVPQIRVLVIEFADLSLAEIEKLLESPWHE